VTWRRVCGWLLLYIGMLIFARKFAGSDSWIDSHNFNGDILSHFLWRLNSSADLIVSAAAGLNASLSTVT